MTRVSAGSAASILASVTPAAMEIRQLFVRELPRLFGQKPRRPGTGSTAEQGRSQLQNVGAGRGVWAPVSG